jgi:hypothetical protein
MTDWGFFVLPASLFFNGLAHLFVTLPFLFFAITMQGEISGCNGLASTFQFFLLTSGKLPHRFYG